MPRPSTVVLFASFGDIYKNFKVKTFPSHIPSNSASDFVSAGFVFLFLVIERVHLSLNALDTQTSRRKRLFL